MKIIEGKSISHVKGFKAIGLNCGIKKGIKDMCLIYSEAPAVAAATFTTNIVKAAPVLLDMKHLQSKNTQALLINSGNANACTGEEGYSNAVRSAEMVSQCLGLDPKEVLIYSTGVIGVQLPMDQVIEGIKKASGCLVDNGDDFAAEAIMTTDTMKKSLFVELELGGKTVSIAGIAKGSGMIHPNMATMLSFIVTDANISKEMLQKIQKESVEKSYNLISVDGDTSTNDTATLLANGCAGNSLIDSENDDYLKLKEAIDHINVWLAKMIAKDGEGATKLIEVDLQGAKTPEDAKKCAKAVVSSSLVKAAVHGSDANWGRILCAMGYSGGNFDPGKVDVSFVSQKGKIEVFKNGVPIVFSEETALKILSEDTIIIEINLYDGSFSSKAWGCDLSAEYVAINGNYRS